MNIFNFYFFTGDKQWQKEQRDKAVLRSQERAEEEKNKRVKVKDELKRYGINQQIMVSIQSV